ncbi:MAG: hypothetical protein M3495_12650 [Pseudomonadota bacterium]|nr:hypothetical protein [Gammaproteobacteria bacterium]MDQ3582390.1 hypothetical protein [Pseudomonadota bacterium]
MTVSNDEPRSIIPELFRIDAWSKWFPDKREQTGSYPTPEQTAEFARTRLDFDALPPNCFVHGHLVRDGIRPFERYGDHNASGRCRLVMTVRDPLERHISAAGTRTSIRAKAVCSP